MDDKKRAKSERETGLALPSEDSDLSVQIAKIFQDGRQSYSSPRVHDQLRKQGVRCLFLLLMEQATFALSMLMEVADVEKKEGKNGCSFFYHLCS